MAKTYKPPFVQTPHDIAVSFVNGTGTTLQDVFVATSEGSRIDKLGITGNDSAGRVVQFYLNNGSTDFLAWTIAVPALSGSDGTTSSINAMNPAIVPWLTDGVLTLPTGWKLRAGMVVAVTAAKTLNIVGTGGDF